MTSLKLDSKLAEKILKIKERVRGIDMKGMADYVIKEAGEEKLREVERLLEKIGHPMPYDEVRKIKVSTLGERLLYLLAIKETLGWDEKKIKEMGYYVGKNLIIIKFFSHLFRINESFFFRVLPQIGSRYMEGLKVVPLEGNVKEKKAIFSVEGLSLENKEELKEIERIGLVYFEGFFAGWAQMIIGAEKVNCKARFQDGKYIFTVTW